MEGNFDIFWIINEVWFLTFPVILVQLVHGQHSYILLS